MQHLSFSFKHAQCVMYSEIRAGAAGEEIKGSAVFLVDADDGFHRVLHPNLCVGSELRKQPVLMRAEISAGSFSSSWRSFSQAVGMLKGPLAFLLG